MSIMITDACINCGACLHICPNDGISWGQHKVVLDATLCTECVGFYSSEQCALVCPIEDVCVRNPDAVETEEVLFERARRIHRKSPTPPTLSPGTSHFRVTAAPPWWKRWFLSRENPLRGEPEVEDVSRTTGPKRQCGSRGSLSPAKHEAV